VDVGDNWHRGPGNDLSESICVLRPWYGNANDVRARLGQAPDLCQTFFDLERLSDGHRLDGNRRPAANLDGSDLNGAGGSTVAFHKDFRRNDGHMAPAL
jgi:hypothetical protein